MSDRLIGRTIGDFRLEELAGRGAVGKVYRATQISLRRTVAVKVLEEGVFTLPELRDRFLREAEFIARLEHPNIVPVYAAGNEEDLYYFAMRFIAGATLAARMSQGIAIAEGIRYLADIAGALAYAHARGILHRDVKPANIMIADGAAVLADFGLARLLERSTLTASGAILGTPLYFSVEQASQEKVTFRSDLHALAVILHELATGRHPYAPCGPEDLLARIRAGVYEPAAHPAIARVVARGLRLEFASAGEFQQALQQLMSLDLGMVTVASPRDETVPASPPPTARPQPSANPDFGKFRLLGRLGHGGMGVVYKAEQVELRRPVALKMLLAEGDDDLLRRFLGEARAAARLRHPNIVPIHEVGDVDGKHYFTMDLIEGEDLEALGARGTIAPKRAVEILRAVARGIAYAHEQGIVHRDLKPANILLDRAGCPMITDFGLAKDLKSDQKLTASNEVFGTPAYMAPEQALGKPSAASDVYALGAVLYFLLTGRAPHQGGTAVDVMLSVLGNDPARPRSIRAGIHADIETICLKAMEKDPRRRYAEAAAFADDCDRFVSGEPIQARPVGLPTRLWRRAVRGRAIAIPAAVALVLVAGFAVWSLAASQRADGARLAEAERLERDGSLHEAAAAYRELMSRQSRARDGLARVEARLREIAAAEADASRLCETGRVPLEAAVRMIEGDDDSFSYERFLAELRKAQAFFRDAIAKAPQFPHASYHLGRALDLEGDEAGAERAWRDALSRDPRFGPAHFQLGRLLLLRAYQRSVGDREDRTRDRFHQARELAEEAERALRAAVEARSGFDEARLRDIAEIQLLVLRGKPAEARAAAEEGARKYPEGTADFHWLRGATLEAPADQAAYAEALKLQPLHWPSILGMAFSHTNLENWARAIELYSAVLRIRPRLAVAFNNRGLARYRLRPEDPDALADFNEAIAIDPDYSPAYVNRSNIWADRKDPARAIDDLTAAIRIHPGEYMAHVNRSVRWLDLGREDRAREDCEAAIRIDGTRAIAWHHLGVIRMSADDPDGAIAAFLCAIDRKKDYADAWAGRSHARFLKKDYRGAIEDVTEAIRLGNRRHGDFARRAICRWRLGDFAGALADFADAIAAGGNRRDLLLDCANVRLDMADFAGALRTADEVQAIDPSHPEIGYLRARAHQGRGEPALALPLLDALLQREPEHAAAWDLRGICHGTLGRLDESIRDHTRAIDLEPDARFYSNRGNSRFRKGDYAGSAEDATEALKLDPEYARSWYGRGAARAAMGDIDAASTDFGEAIRLRPDYLEARIERARVHLRRKRYAEAEADLTAAVEAHPKSVDALLARADLRLHVGDLDRAIADATAVLALDAESVDARVARGYAGMKKADYAGAIADLDEALRLKPDHLMAAYFRAAALHDRGDLQEAIRAMEELLRRAPADWSARAKAERVLETWKREPK